MANRLLIDKMEEVLKVTGILTVPFDSLVNEKLN